MNNNFEIKETLGALMGYVDDHLHNYEGIDHIIYDIKLNPKIFNQTKFIVKVYPIIKIGMTKEEIDVAKKESSSMENSINIYLSTIKTSHPKRPLTNSVYEYLNAVGYKNFTCMSNYFKF